MKLGSRIPERPFIKPENNCTHTQQNVNYTVLNTAFGQITIYIRNCKECNILVLYSDKDAPKKT